MKEITVTVSPSGKTVIDVTGFNGSSCDKATQNIELVLSAGKETDKSRKPDYSQPGSTSCEVKRVF